MAKLLKNKVAIVTGSSRGIGKAILEKLASQGANIIACSSKKNKNHKKYCETLAKKNKVNIIPIFFNLDNQDEIKNGIEKIKKLNIKINYLINNAGIITTSSFQMTKEADLAEVFRVNFFSQFYFTQHVSKMMIRTNGSKSIVNISSSTGLDNDSGRSVYSASKASLISLSSTLSKELAAFKIRVNTIAPGLTETDMMKNNTKKEYIEQALTHISLKRIGKPEEIANVVFFLCSDLSSYVNGQTIRVDGGMH